MKMTWRQLILLIVLAVVMAPVSADAGNTSNTTAVPTTAETTLTTTATTTVATDVTTAAVNATATVTTAAPTTTTAVPVTTTQTTVPATTSTTVATTALATLPSSGDISVASSPLGAAILIDGVYHGTTPGNVTGLVPGNHIIRLALSGYMDYEGTFYVVAGQSIPVYGTLHPVSGSSSQIILATASLPVTTAVPVTTVAPAATQTTSGSALDNPTVLAALIGIVTACIGAGATIFTHNANVKKQEDEKKP